MRNLVILVLIVSVVMGTRSIYRHTDAYTRSVVVKISSTFGSCTGVRLKGKSGRTYTVTAGHCAPLLENGGYTVTEEDGSSHQETLVAESQTADILVLTSSVGPAADLGTTPAPHAHIHTMGHGKGHISYRTDGEMLEDALNQVGGDIIRDINDIARCNKPKNELALTPNGLMCLITARVIQTSAMVVPGSSGGPLFDEDNNVVGITSASDGFFSSFARTIDIYECLKNL